MSARVYAVVVALASAPFTVHAQQTQLDLHGNLAVGTSTHARAWGAGVGLQTTYGGKIDPINISTLPSVDLVKQEGGGPTQLGVSFDVDVQPGGGSTVTPYVGASAGANWSLGNASQWGGARLGLETLAGAQVKIGGTSIKAEERFGYVKGQEHTLTTRIGALLSF
jgi:hypothetical protein